MPRLSELQARLIWEPSEDWNSFNVEGCPKLEEARGIIFLCPKCFITNNGPIGTHSVLCWFRDRGVPDEVTPKPGRWTPQGTSIEDITFVPGNPPRAISVLLTGDGCGWHGFVVNGSAD